MKLNFIILTVSSSYYADIVLYFSKFSISSVFDFSLTKYKFLIYLSFKILSLVKKPMIPKIVRRVFAKPPILARIEKYW